jgi:hypothetical protein
MYKCLFNAVRATLDVAPAPAECYHEHGKSTTGTLGGSENCGSKRIH